jgi:hypothetical protein
MSLPWGRNGITSASLVEHASLASTTVTLNSTTLLIANLVMLKKNVEVEVEEEVQEFVGHVVKVVPS